MGVEGASIATSISQCVTFVILAVFYLSGKSIIKISPKYFSPTGKMLKEVISIGVPSAVVQICLSIASSLTNMAAKSLADADLIIAAYGVVQRLVLIGCYVVMGFMQGYQPVASYAYGAKNEARFQECLRFAIKGTMVLCFTVAFAYILLATPLISSFNSNPVVISYGARLLRFQMILFPVFGLSYMMTITYQTIGNFHTGLFLSLIRQGIFYLPFIILLPKYFGFTGICLAQPCADAVTLLVCLYLINPMKEAASQGMRQTDQEQSQSLDHLAHQHP